MLAIDRARLHRVLKLEQDSFIESHQRSLELTEKAKITMPSGVPMNWMIKWASPCPIFIHKAEGSHFFILRGNIPAGRILKKPPETHRYN